jgi:hypothetical protein
VHFDFFFDQADKKMKGAGKSKKDGKAKKDGQTGIYFLRELLDPNRSPMGNGVSMLQGAFPEVKHLIFSGDTGNGFRAYAMLDELSCVYEKYGYTVELSPLAPGHAWNRTDARIAHMNTFLRLLKARSRVFGAKGVAAAFHAASDQSLKNRRQYMERSYIFFREVEVDQDQAAETRKSLGNMIRCQRRCWQHGPPAWACASHGTPRSRTSQQPHVCVYVAKGVVKGYVPTV